jgi:tetratricopeptide (TPR) repeat protein
LNPAGAFVDYLRSVHLLRLGRHPRATELLNRLAWVHPEWNLVQLALGEMELQQERYPQALERFDRALELKPGSAAAHVRKGVAFRRLQRDLDAVIELSEAIQRDPQLDSAKLELREILFPQDA